METTNQLPNELLAKLNEPLPKEAVQAHPTKDFLSTIKAIYAVERLNQIFGVGGWIDNYDIIENPQPVLVGEGDKAKLRAGMIVVKGHLHIPEYGIVREAFGGNDNPDRGDAYKGACTDALTKMCASIGIGMDVYKGLGPTTKQPNGRKQPEVISSRQFQPSKPFPMSVTIVESTPVKGEVIAKVKNDLGEYFWKTGSEPAMSGLLDKNGQALTALVTDTGALLKKLPVFTVHLLNPTNEALVEAKHSA
jgi:hypothetical protein